MTGSTTMVRPIAVASFAGVLFATFLGSTSARALTAQQAIEGAEAKVDVLVRFLSDNPRFAPSPLDDERPVQIVIHTGPDGRADHARILPLRQGSLERDRQRALRVGRRPEAWLVVLDSSTLVPVWWAPLGRPAELHQELDTGTGRLTGTQTVRPSGIAAVRAPFVPGGIVLRVDAHPPGKTVVVDEAMIFGRAIEDGILVLPRDGTP